MGPPVNAEVRVVRPLAAPPDVVVTVPGSKSLTNRALVAAALASGPTTLIGALFSDDTEAMLTALATLGLTVSVDGPAQSIRVDGWDGQVPPGPASLDVRQAGTAARFLPPLLSLGRGPYIVDGSDQMRARPMAGMVAALRQLGLDVQGTGSDRGLPLELRGGPVAGGTVRLSASTTSQFLSGLLLSAPYYRRGLVLEADGEPVSRPYLDMTTATMAAFGIDVVRDGYRRFEVRPGQRYRGRVHAIEPDATAASYFFAAAAVAGGRVRVEGIGRSSVQGDIGFVDVLERMGAEVVRGDTFTEVTARPLQGIEVDMADISDTAPTLAVVATFASTPTRMTGIGFIRRKETDRIASVVAELRRCGIVAEELDDGLVVHPGIPRATVVETYDDHRMAMAFSLLGLTWDGIAVSDPGCVAKTFPDFFATLDRLR